MGETAILMTIIFFIAIAGFISLYLPTPLKILNTFEFAWFGGGIIGLAAACSIWSGVGCAAALALFGIGSLTGYLTANIDWITTLIMLPITIVIIYIVSRLSQGGG